MRHNVSFPIPNVLHKQGWSEGLHGRGPTLDEGQHLFHRVYILSLQEPRNDAKSLVDVLMCMANYKERKAHLKKIS